MTRENDAQRFEYPDTAGYPDGAGYLDEGTAVLVAEVTVCPVVAAFMASSVQYADLAV